MHIHAQSVVNQVVKQPCGCAACQRFVVCDLSVPCLVLLSCLLWKADLSWEVTYMDDNLPVGNEAEARWLV